MALEAYQQIEPRDQTYHQLARLLWTEKKGKELDSLVAAHRANGGDKANFQLEIDAARAKILLNQPDEAIRHFRAATEKLMDRFLVQDLTGDFVRDMNTAGHGIAAYNAASTKNEAFKILAELYVRKPNEKALDALLAEHGKKHAQDLWYLHYRWRIAFAARRTRPGRPRYQCRSRQGRAPR